jgi:hypothetical protein
VWEYEAYLVLTPDSPKGFDWYMSALADVQNFLLLCIGQPIYPRSVVASEPQPEGGGENRPNDIRIYYHFSHRKERKTLADYEMLMPLESLRHMLPQMLNAWFDKAERLRDVYNLFFSTFYNESMYLESVFLNLIQALETYSRATMDAKYVTPEEYQKIAAALNAAIPAETPSSLKQSLKSRIKYGNEYSLRKRVDGILSSLEPETVKLVCPNTAKLRDSLVDTRNYLTHYTEELKEDAIRGPGLFYANLRMKLLLTIVLCKEIGVEEKSIRSALLKDNKWMQLIHLYTERDI